jgi:hypothetical protein
MKAEMRFEGPLRNTNESESHTCPFTTATVQQVSGEWHIIDSWLGHAHKSESKQRGYYSKRARMSSLVVLPPGVPLAPVLLEPLDGGVAKSGGSR